MISRRSAFGATLAFASVAAMASAATTKKLSKKELKALIETAKTAADHQRLANYYAALAVGFEEEAKEHSAEAEAYEKNPTIQEMKNPGGGNTASHCRFFAAKYTEMAESARTMSTMHSEMAKNAK